MKTGKRKAAYQFNLISKISEGVSLVDFNAGWCALCKVQGPIVDTISKKFQGKAFVTKLDVDEHPDPATSFGITSIPILIVFKNESEVQRFIGIQSEEDLTETLEKALNSLPN